MPVEIQAFFESPTGDRKDPIIGIDLGTTNSLVAIVRDGKPEVLTSREGRRLIPSVISWKDGKLVIGYAAKKMKLRDPRHTAFSVKRLLGRNFFDLPQVGNVPFEIQASKEDPTLRIRLSDDSNQTLTPIEISSRILRELKLAAESDLKTPISRAVITVPAYFNDSQRQATRTAARLAGLDVMRIVNEPTAAALAYGLDRKREGLIAVYDLGGGTFDISILKLHNGIFEVLATSGDTALGGDDIDLAIARAELPRVTEAWGVDPFAEVESHAAILEAAENLKIAFSENSKADFELSLSGRKTYRHTWTQEEFDCVVRGVLERTRKSCEQALRDAGLVASELSDVVMVGGPTRLPVVQRFTEEVFGRKPNTSMHPDEVVAEGAAIQADILAGNNRDLLLLDVVPLSLGIETYGGLMSILIPRNTKVPTVARESFTTFVDNQTGVDIHVLQGERDRVEENRSLARFKLAGIERLPAGIPRIEVTFLVDADGILNVAAKDLRTGNEQSVEVRPSYGLTDLEVERMLAQSQEKAVEDIRFRILVETRNEADPVLRASEKNLEAAFRLLPQEEAKQVELRVNALRTAINGNDPESIKVEAQKLNQATVRLAELILTETLQKAQSQQG